MNSMPIPVNVLRALARVVPGLRPRGVSRGRFFTCDAAPNCRPFIVREISSEILRKHVTLSKNARALFLTMLSLADAKTGELRLPSGHWLDSGYIRREAEMGRDKFRNARRELLEAGLISDDRERSLRKPRGCNRWYWLLDRSRYSVRLEFAKFGQNLLGPDLQGPDDQGHVVLSNSPLKAQKKNPGPSARDPYQVPPPERAKETSDRAKVEARDARLIREAKLRAESQVGAYDPNRIVKVDEGFIEEIKRRHPDLSEQIFGKTQGGGTA
jgi:hypothetical protein